LERLQAGAGDGYVIGQDRDRDRKRREELRRLKLSPGLTDAQAAEMAEFDAFYEKEDRDSRRRSQLFYKDLNSRFSSSPALTDAERIEYAELKERYPPDPNNPYKELAARLRAIAGSASDGRGRNKFESGQQQHAQAVVEECVISEPNRAPAPGRSARNVAEKRKQDLPDEVSDAELLEQLMSAANDNVVPGEGIDDVGPIKAMLESGIELDDVLYTLKSQVDRRAYPGNRALTSWSEHRFVLAVAEAYGRRVILPVIAEKLKARRKPTYARASSTAACTDDGGIE